MKRVRFVCLLAALGLLSLAPTRASATVLTFDDLNLGNGDPHVVPTSYGGLTFNGWNSLDNPPLFYPVASAPTIVYNSQLDYTNTPEILSAAPMDVLSAYFADYSSGFVTLHGYLGATELYTVTIFPSLVSMTQYPLNFLGIDRFVMEVGIGEYAFMDNFEFQPAAVPEPATMLLFGIGVVGAIRMRRLQAQR
jgi:hypothetical protein